MNILGYFLTQKLTGKVLDKAAQDGMDEDDSCKVQMVAAFGYVFLITAIIGAVIGIICICFHQITAGIIVLLFSGGISAPGLCAHHNCLLTYDKEGFTWRNWLGRSCRYSYEDVTGLYNSPLRVVVELSDGRRIDLDEFWVNRLGFAQALCRYRSHKPAKLMPPVAGMSNSEIAESYEKGVLAMAVLVQKNDRPMFGRFKKIHYLICTFSWITAAFPVLSFNASKLPATWEVLGLLGLPGLVLTLAAMILYFRYPEYFTMRERPTEGLVSQENKKIHKRCTVGYTSLLSVPGSLIFFIYQVQGKAALLPLLTSAVVAVLLFTGLLLLFRRYSWEYRNYGVGYVSYGFYQVLLCSSVFFVLGGLLVS